MDCLRALKIQMINAQPSNETVSGGGALTNGMNAFTKETPQPVPHEDRGQRQLSATEKRVLTGSRL